MKGRGGGARQRRILELNPDHPIVAGLERRFRADAAAAAVGRTAELLFGYACLAEGSEVPDPVRFNAALTELLAGGLAGGAEGGGGGAAADAPASDAEEPDAGGPEPALPVGSD
jgi:hypothetical protein